MHCDYVIIKTTIKRGISAMIFLKEVRDVFLLFQM